MGMTENTAVGIGDGGAGPLATIIVSPDGNTYSIAAEPGFTPTGWQWQRANSDGSGKAPIAGATNATYPRSGADSNKKLFCNLTGVYTNTDGIQVPAAAVTPPVNVSAPVVNGAPTVGAATSYAAGSWTGANSVAAKWQLSNTSDGSTASDVSSSATYTPILGDIGKYLGIQETATNATGSVIAKSAIWKAVQAVINGTLIEAFESLTGWTNQASAGTMSLDTTRKVQGAGAFRLDCKGVNSTSFATKAGAFTADPSTFELVAYYTDIDARRPVQQIGITFGRAGVYSVSSTGASVGMYDAPRKCWQTFNVSEDNTIPTGVAATDLRIRPTLSAPYTGGFTVDALVVNAPKKATICLTFDDLENTIYTYAFPRMQALGIKGTVYVPPSYVGVSDSMTMPQLKAVDTAGWDVAGDATMNDSSLLALPSLAAAVDSVSTVRQWLVDNDFLRGKDHLCYPFGDYHLTTTPVMFASLTADGTNVVTVPSTTGVGVGFSVYGYGVPAGVTVLSITNATTMVVSANIPAQALPAAAVDETHWSSGRTLPDALAAAGFKTGRTTNGDNYTRFGFGNTAMMLGGAGFTGSTQAARQAFIERAVKRGLTVIDYFHRITPAGGSIDVSEAFFDWYINYLATERDAGRLEILTVSEMYERDVGGASLVPS